MSHEDREKEESQLGELTRPILKERGGFPPISNQPLYEQGQPIPPMGFDRNTPPDIDYQQDVRRQVDQFGQLGTQPQKTFVTSTFDARPINGVDFLVKEKVRVAFQNPNGAAVDIPGEVAFEVPPNYIGILKGFAWSFEVPILPKDDNDNFELVIDNVSVLINNTRQNFYDNLQAYGTHVPDLLPCYFIAETGQEIKLRVQLGNKAGGNVTNTTLYDQDMTITLYGNLLLSRGLPAQFEPGSF